MLTPEYLNKCPEYFIQLYQELEDFILKDVARRIAKAGEITDTAQWQMLRLKELGMATKEIRQKITQINEMTLREINAVFQNAARESFDFEEKIYSKAGEKAHPAGRKRSIAGALVRCYAADCWRNAEFYPVSGVYGDGQWKGSVPSHC